jgi:hypothetical protein
MRSGILGIEVEILSDEDNLKTVWTEDDSLFVMGASQYFLHCAQTTYLL